MASTLEDLRTFLQDVAKKENYSLSKIDIKPITSGGANYTTDLYLATISEASKPDINVFAKAANLNEEVRKSSDFLSRVYEIEAAFYTELVVHFERIYNKHQVPVQDRLVIPKYYGHILIPYKEIMVLENLEVKGFKNFDRMKTFSWEYASTAVTQLAKFHALGLALREEDLEIFENIVQKFKGNFADDKHLISQLVQMAFQNGMQSLNDDLKQRLLKYFSSMDKLQEWVSNTMQDSTMLIHSDFRPSNMMHRRKNGKLEVIVLDYQTLRMGNPVIELIQFIYSGSDAEFRRFHYQRLMDHYFSQLTLALKQLNVDVEKVYPRKTFDANLTEMRPLGLIFGLAITAMVTVDPEDAPKLEGDITSIQIKTNQLGQERTIGIAKDFVRWGVL